MDAATNPPTRVPRYKIAVVAPNWLGDAVMSLPLVGALGATRGASVAVVAPPYTARVYAGVAGIDEVVVDPAGSRTSRVVSRARSLSALGVDACVLLPPSFSSALSPWLARVPVRVGYAGDARAGLLTDALTLPPRASEHLSESYAALGRTTLGRLGLSPVLDVAPPAVRVLDRDEEEARRVRDGFNIERRGYVAIAPGATYGPAKSWPVDRFRETARAICDHHPVLLLGGPRERDICDAVADGMTGVHSAAGRTSLGGFFALLAGARVLVANDSGAPHAAAALGVPVVVLFGSTSPEWTRPLGDDVTVIRHPVHCAPCFRRTCPTQLECFDGISTREVVEAALAAFGRTAPKKEVAPAHRGR